MQAICGYVRLDGAPVPDATLSTLTSGLCPNPGMRPSHHGSRLDSIAVGHSGWGGHWQAPGDALLRDEHCGCTVIADARLDERRRLARQLGLTQPPESVSTARLILSAWQRWGEQCAEHLRGDFAFAVWDARQRKLYLARDIMGVRPLHVHHQPGRLLAFASRAAALVALPDIPDDLNTGRIADALVTQLESIDKTSTFYRRVQRVPPAHWASYAPNNCRQRRYWRPEPGQVALPSGDDEWAQALTEALETAVRRHLDGAARVGSMLSGGMDSSSLAMIAADQLATAGAPALATFSSVTDDPVDPETRAIHAMLEKSGFAPTLLGPAEIEAMRVPLTRALHQADEPFDGSMALVHAQYLGASRAGVDALIDGSDGDSLLSEGSTLPRQLRRGRWYASWRNIRGLQQTYPGLSAWRYGLLLMRAAFIPEPIRRPLRRDRLGTQTRRAIDASLIAPEFAQRVNLRQRLRQLNAWSRPAHTYDTTAQAARALAHPNTICGLERYHRVAAWHGVQPRHPMTDRDVLELCVNLPDSGRLANGLTKASLRRAMQGRLPDLVCGRQDKQHLGWGLNRRLLLDDTDALRRQLQAQRHALAPFVDLDRMDKALTQATQGSDVEAALATLLAVVGLGNWLAGDKPTRHQQKFQPACVITQLE